MDDELAAAHRRTAKLAYDSMLTVDRAGWTDDQWIEDAHRLMDHPDGSSACLLNGHIWALFHTLDTVTRLRSELVRSIEAAEERGAARVRERVEKVIEATEFNDWPGQGRLARRLRDALREDT